MNKHDFDKNFVIAILAGGIGIMFYDIIQLTYKFLITQTISYVEFTDELGPKGFAGISVALFALFYAIITRKNTSTN